LRQSIYNKSLGADKHYHVVAEYLTNEQLIHLLDKVDPQGSYVLLNILSQRRRELMSQRTET
jgi:hypothetical protein